MNITAASAIIKRNTDQKIFLAQRSFSKKLSPGLWETVGGGIEIGETPEACLRREIQEELGVDVATISMFKDYPGQDRCSRVFIVTLSDEPRPVETDFQAWGWFAEDEIETLVFALDCKQRVMDYFSL